jgi:phage terminase small subunit
MTKAKVLPKPPKHLKPATRRWWVAVHADYELEEHHSRLLTLGCEAWDRAQDAREAVGTHGLTYLDRWDVPHPRPEVAIERDSRIAFARLVRELGLDLAGEPETPRSNRIGGQQCQ